MQHDNEVRIEIINEAWSCLARKKKTEVPVKDKVHEASWHKYVGRGEP